MSGVWMISRCGRRTGQPTGPGVAGTEKLTTEFGRVDDNAAGAKRIDEIGQHGGQLPRHLVRPATGVTRQIADHLITERYLYLLHGDRTVDSLIGRPALNLHGIRGLGQPLKYRAKPLRAGFRRLCGVDVGEAVYDHPYSGSPSRIETC
jgi:hypothetical protein